MIESTNKEWGFYGALDTQAEAAWPLALTAIEQATGFDEADCAVFLDSKLGRWFSDDVRNALHGGKPLKEAIDAAVARWSQWKLPRHTLRQYEIPSGATYLQGFVAVAAIG